MTASVTCSEEDCKGVQLTANLPSGLSTATANPQGCGILESGESCTKSWTVSTNSVGTHSITVTASANNAASKTSSAVSVTVNAVCGDGTCEGSETSSTCSQDCPASTPTPTPTPTPAPAPTPTPSGTISMNVLSPTTNQQFIRGEKMLVKVKVTSGDILTDADVAAEIFSQTFKLHDDGLHNDDKTNDGIYAAEIGVKQSYEGIYKLVITASKSGHTGAVDSREIIVNPLLNVTAVLEKAEYFKGGKMIIEGIVKDGLNRSVQGGNLDVVMTSGLFKVARKSEVGVTGNFFLDYFIGFGDSEGNWSINVSVVDFNKNHGFKILSLSVKTPPAGTFYYAKFLSPTEGLAYSRGETMKISIEVTEADKSVANATVSWKTPKGGIMVLNETSPGVYTSAYVLGWDDPIGDINIIAEGIKEVEGKLKAGGNFISIAVKPVELKLDLILPSKSNFVIGETLKIAAKAFYPDGTSVGGASVFVESPKGEKIFLKEEEEGSYKADYKIKTGEEGRWQMQLKAVDAYENSALLQRAIFIGEITIFYLLLQYWYLAVIGVSPFAYLGYRLTRFVSAKSRMENMREELKRVVEMEKEAQIKYYKKGSMDKDTYASLMKEYEQKEQDLKAKIGKTKDKNK